MRANIALVFIKPHAHTPACIEFVRNELAKKTRILGESDMQNISDEIVDQHYAEISKHANGVPAELPVTDAAFNEKFGFPWDPSCVFNAADAAAKLGGDEPLSSK
ncbi:MAG: hypothetical protein AAF658_04670, partial [Myxococcota bacterium]